MKSSWKVILPEPAPTSATTLLSSEVVRSVLSNQVVSVRLANEYDDTECDPVISTGIIIMENFG